MEWNVQDDYDPENETINFGTRAFAESDGCIYETSTVATFQSGSEISDVPAYTFGDIPRGGLCVCVGHSLTVFGDASTSSVLFNMDVDAAIETFTCTPDGNFLIVGLCNGFIHVFHIPTEGTPVFMKKLSTVAKGGRMFSKIIVDDSYPEGILVVGASGVVIQVSHFDFGALHNRLSEDPSSNSKDILSKISIDSVCGFSSIAPIRDATVLKWRHKLMIVAAGAGIATLSISFVADGESEVKWTEKSSTSTFIKLESVTPHGPFLALSNLGQLVSVCPFMLKIKKLRQESVKFIHDFQFAGSNLSDTYAVFVSSCREDDHSTLSLQTFPDMVEKFSLPVKKHSALMSSKGDVEDIHYLEFDLVTSIVALKAARQTIPKFRMDRLLTRRKFEAAEALAKNFGLDLSPVHQARALDLLDQMEPWSKKGSVTPNGYELQLQSFFNELDKISDLDFVSNCCVNAVPPDYHVALSLLKYAQKRLQLFVVNNPEVESKVSEWFGSVCGSILRLETYNLLKPSWNVEKWLEFSAADLLREVQSCIKQGQLSGASIIWSRHKYSFQKRLKDEHIVQYLLEAVPNDISVDEVLTWLARLLPSLLEVQPSAVTKVVAYMHLKIIDLERSCPKQWPKVGLDYTEKTLKLISCQKFAIPFIGLEASPLRPLVVLRCALNALHSLRSKYYIYMTLEEFRQDPTDVALHLLDSIDVGSISAFFTEYLNGFILEHRLGADDIISRYIKCVVDNSDGWWHWEEAPWELRISRLISHITNYKIRLECISSALEAAPVPWSPVISSMAEEGLKLKHPLTSLIREKQMQIGTNLILKKYGIRALISKIDIRNLLRYIVKQNHPDMLSDIAEIAQLSVKNYSTVIGLLFSLGNIPKALQVLQSLPGDKIVQLCPMLINRSSCALDLPRCDIGKELEIMSAVALCHETAAASNPPGLTHIEDLNDPKYLFLPLEDLQNRFRLKRDFGKYLTIEEMSSTSCCRRALKEIVQDLLIEICENEKSHQRYTRVYYQSLHASRLLNVPKNWCLVELLQQAMDLSDLELAAYVTGYIDDLESVPDSLYKKLIKLPCLYFTKLDSGISKDMDVKTLHEAASALHGVLSQVCTYCRPDDLQKALDSFGWARIWSLVSGQGELALIGQRDPLQIWRFTPLYRDPGLSSFLNGSLVNYFLYAAFKFSNNTLGEGDDFLSNLEPSILKLQNDQQDVAVVTVLCQIFSSIQRFSKQLSPDMVCAIQRLQQKSYEVLLGKVAGARQFDKQLGVSLLVCMGQSKALDYLERMCKSSQDSFHRQKNLSCLGFIVCDLWKLADLHDYFKLMSVQSTWGLRLSDLGIPAKDLLCGRANADIVLQKLLGSKNVLPSLLQALCSDYQFDLQDVLLQHLCAILLSWDPDPIVTVNADGTKDVIERNTQQQLLEQCWEIQKNIKDKKHLCEKLCHLWKQINFYHHEVFLVVLELLERHGVAGQTSKSLITTFLKNYRRVKAPDQAEEEYWGEIFPNSFRLPAMSEFRLAYSRRIIDDPLTVVKNEVNLKTYKSWLTVAEILELPKDNICTMAIHQTVVEEFCGYQSGSEWCGTHKNEDLLQSVADCVANMEDVLKAAAALCYFTNKIPLGVDQVSAASLCVEYAEILYNQTGQTEMKVKIEKKYLYLATLQSLHTYGLGQENYLQLAQKPSELIPALYQHPTILEQYRGTASHSLDINAAAEEISKLHSISLKALHLNLVTEWLRPENVVDYNTSFDDDSFGSLNVRARKDGQHTFSEFSDLHNADDSILRACYVMDYGDVQEWAHFLLQLAYTGDACIGMKLRAMQCLCMLTDDETLEDLSGRSMDSIREKLHTLAFLKHLEVLGLTYSEEGFHSCNKNELANLVLRTRMGNPHAVSLLVHLCVENNTRQLSLWNSILQQLVELNLMKEVEQALSHTSEMFELWALPNFSKAWNLLLTSPFVRRNYSSEEEHESAMFHAISLFPTCPIMENIEVADALEYCISNGRPEIAALLFPFLQKTETLHWREKILSVTTVDGLLQDVKKIAADRCIDVSKVLGLFFEKAT
ncbi:hypothetical protein ONE63_005972 [Megalurothrips usitatus]|uniref:Kinetochore-associated protein 1 n=1 Tax=Megalurothrips usitatus TaxID=439358 RepID=A0AAV7XZE5_9NEOP|nr:hypothetical protein ONE63_005972 [Megalurothrips usitatus]